MPTWNQLLTELQAQPTDEAKGAWLTATQQQLITDLSTHLGGRNVAFYGSAFLQKQAPNNMISIHNEDVQAFMSVIHGMQWDKGLTLMLHTPGGNPNAAQSIVEYLRSKFESLEVIVPVMAMSAGTMISLASDKIYMGRQSQLGPIDPQYVMGNRAVSARGIVEQFERARDEILQNPEMARVWAPITQSLGPAMLQDAQNALDYSETMVAEWLARYMFKDERRAKSKGKATARHFNDASKHKSHGRRIDMAEAAKEGVNVEALEKDQTLQELVLSLYHLVSILFDHSMVVKVVFSSTGAQFVKQLAQPQPQP